VADTPMARPVRALKGKRRAVHRAKTSRAVTGNRSDTMLLVPGGLEASPPPPKAVTKGNAGWYALPVVAVLLVVGYIAYDLYCDSVEHERLAEDAAASAAAVRPMPQPKVESPPPPLEEKPDLELAPLPVGALKDEPKKPPTAKAQGSSGAQALRALQADFERLSDDAVQRRFRLRLEKLKAEVGTQGEAPGFLSKVEGLHAQVRAELAMQR
jgi:hypothetical protein